MSSTNERKSKASAGTILMRVSGILLAITALTVWGTSFLLAKYTTGGKGGDSARVAKFDVNATMEDKTVVVDVSKTASGKFEITLTNLSETAVRAGITLDFTTLNTTYKDDQNQNVPIITKVKIGNADSYTNVVDNKLVIPDTFDMAAGSGEITPAVTFTLTIPELVNDNNALLAITKTMTGLKGETAAYPFDVVVTFTQID